MAAKHMKIVIQGQEAEFKGWSATGTLLLADGRGFELKPIDPVLELASRNDLRSVSALVPVNKVWIEGFDPFVKWCLDEVPLDDELAKPLRDVDTDRVMVWLYLQDLFNEHLDLNQEHVAGVAWFTGIEKPVFLRGFRPAPPSPYDDTLEKAQAVADQIGNQAAAMQKAVQPLTKLYSEPELAEVRKRASGRGVPEMFTDWVLRRFMESNPERLPTKGDAYDHCGHDTLIGKKLSDAGFGISKQWLARHLTVIRRALEDKGWLARAKGKTRRRASGFTVDDRQEDINQPTPFESAADRDDERSNASDLADDEQRSNGASIPQDAD